MNYKRLEVHCTTYDKYFYWITWPQIVLRLAVKATDLPISVKITKVFLSQASIQFTKRKSKNADTLWLLKQKSTNLYAPSQRWSFFGGVAFWREKENVQLFSELRNWSFKYQSIQRPLYIWRNCGKNNLAPSHFLQSELHLTTSKTPSTQFEACSNKSIFEAPMLRELRPGLLFLKWVKV